MIISNEVQQNSNLFTILIFSLFTTLLLSMNETQANMFSSNNNYSEFIQLKPYIMNSGQVGKVFQHTGNNAIQLAYKDLRLNELYLVIMVKNNGNKTIWGTLKCFIDHREVSTLDIPPISGNMDKFVAFVVPIHGVILPQIAKKPQFDLEWIKLNTK